MTPSLSTPPARTSRIVSIDALRGFVILLMLVDHARETFYLDHQVSDPMDLATTPPALFFTRIAAHLCAPVFVLLTGLAAWLYGAGKGPAAVSAFLLKRGLFLIVLELTVVGFAWSFDPLPPMMYLQVIWAIGLSMIALAALVHLPRGALVMVGFAIVFGHNLLDGIRIAAGEPGHAAWAILHQRDIIDLPWGARARTSYPLLPWIGVIALGYGMGPWFSAAVDPLRRRRLLVIGGAASLALFAVLRAINGYGDPVPWVGGGTTLGTVMGVVNLTKYPPSADFLLATLGVGLLLLAALERWPGRAVALLAVYGSAPLFFYILHIFVLQGANRIAGLAVGSDGARISVSGVGQLWLIAATVAVPCWFACRAFAAAKRRSGAWWMRYL